MSVQGLSYDQLTGGSSAPKHDKQDHESPIVTSSS